MIQRVKWFLFSALLFLVITGTVASGDMISPRMRELMGEKMFRYAQWGLLAVDIQSGETIYALNADKMFKPGSTTKIFTVSTALNVFGEDHRPRGHGSGQLLQRTHGSPRDVAGRARRRKEASLRPQDRVVQGAGCVGS